MSRILFPVALVLLVLVACEPSPVGPTQVPDRSELSILAAPISPEAFDYQILRLPDSFNALRTHLEHINARGELFGWYFTRDELDRVVQRGFAYRKGEFETVHLPGALGTLLFGANEQGIAVGSFADESGPSRGLIYDRGSFSTLDLEEFPRGIWLRGINAAGVIAGHGVDAQGGRHAFIRDHKGVRTLEVPGALWTEAFAINARGDVAGHFAYPGDPRMYGFVFSRGDFTILDYPGVSESMTCALGLGVRGDVVGRVDGIEPGVVHGYVWRDGQFTGLLRPDGAVQTHASAILANGTIAGKALLADGDLVAFLATLKYR
jgi:hypothetical protein